MPLATQQPFASSLPPAVVREFGPSLPAVYGDAFQTPVMPVNEAANLTPQQHTSMMGGPPGAPLLPQQQGPHMLATQSMRNLNTNFQPSAGPAGMYGAPPVGAPGVGPMGPPATQQRDSRGNPGPAAVAVVPDDEPEKAHGLKRLRQKLHLHRRHKS